jgi:saccharopine dehydrogenase-like NADP-dependent oxidoreductase
MRTVILGGTGNFGARIARDLARDANFDVIVASRTPDASRLPFIGRHARLDIGSPGFAQDLARLSPKLIIHCAGPFQGQDYRVGKAALAARAHYIDLADAREFVTRFGSQFESAAREAHLLMLSGASTVPALSSAVVDSLLHRFQRLDEIQVAIAPGQRAPRGVATIEAVLSYVGVPFKRRRNGEWQDAWGWQELRRMHFVDLGARWAAACDIPDLALFPVRYPGVRTVEFRAALEVGIQHVTLWILAALRRMGIPLPTAELVQILSSAARLLEPFGGEDGGMLVELSGIRSDGRPGRVGWHLTARANDGPEIPCMAATLLARKLARGDLALRGASPAIGVLSLAEFEEQFARWKLSARIVESDAFAGGG